MDDDLWRLRLRRDGSLDPDPDVSGRGCPAFVGRVTSTGSNLGVGKFCMVVPVSVAGAEAEGGAASLIAGTAPVLAYPLGPSAPATGDLVEVRRVRHRWVFERWTGSPPPAHLCVQLGGCSAPVATITYTFGDGTVATPTISSTNSACYAAPLAAGTVTFGMPAGYTNPGPVAVPASPGGLLTFESHRETFDFTSDEAGRCCNRWPSTTLTYADDYPYSNPPRLIHRGWYSPLFHQACGPYDPGFDFCLVLQCPDQTSNGVWALMQVANTTIIAGAVFNGLTFLPPPSSLAVTPFGCPTSHLYLT